MVCIHLLANVSRWRFENVERFMMCLFLLFPSPLAPFKLGWWQYDERTCEEIEEAYKNAQKQCTILVAGNLYVVDFDQMLQKRQTDPGRKRQVKRK